MPISKIPGFDMASLANSSQITTEEEQLMMTATRMAGAEKRDIITLVTTETVTVMVKVADQEGEAPDYRSRNHNNLRTHNPFLILSKFDTEGEKYCENNGNFNFQLFNIISLFKTFPIMLDYSALDLFRNKHVGLTPVYPELCDYMQNDFEGAEYQLNMLSQCDSITLYSSRVRGETKVIHSANALK